MADRSISHPRSAPPPVHLGYSTSAFEQQRALERRFRDAVSTERLSTFHAAVTRQPHMSGTPGSDAVAEYLKKALADAGFDVDVFEYRAYLSVAKAIAVDVVAPVAQTLSVVEPPSDLDPDTNHPGLGHGFVAYSASGDVAATGQRPSGPREVARVAVRVALQVVLVLRFGLPECRAHATR